jgi:uncharacterized protein with HEPN domain
MVNLETTNWLLAVIALGSAVQMLALIGVSIVGYRLYRQTSAAIEQLEVRHIAPLRQRVDAILERADAISENVQSVTARVSQQTQRADEALSSTIERVDETAERVKHSVRDKVSQVTGVVRGVRAIITSLLASDSPAKPPAEAGGRA